MTKTTENNGTYTQLAIFQNLNPGECLLVKWFQEAPSWLAQNKKSLKFRVSRLLENDISEKCIIELKNISLQNSKIYLDKLVESYFWVTFSESGRNLCVFCYFEESRKNLWQSKSVKDLWKKTKSHESPVNPGELATMHTLSVCLLTFCSKQLMW